MPLYRRHGTAVAALLFALGGTAVVTWAYSLFAEDKKKVSSPHSSNDSHNASLKDGEDKGKAGRDKNENFHQRNGNIPIVNTLGFGYKAGKCDFIPEYFYKTSGDKQNALVIENKSAKQRDDGSRAGQQVENGVKELPAVDDVMEEIREDEVAPQNAGVFTSQKIPTSSIFPQTSLNQRQSYLNDDYNSQLSKTSVSDLVTPDKPAQVSVSERSSVDSSPLASPTSGVFSEQESKVTTLEEKQIAMEELVEPATTMSMATSVSSRSLKSAVMKPPPKKGKRSFV